MTLDDLQTWPEPDDESPFRRLLVPHPDWASPHIRQFDGDPRFVVRLVPALQLASSPDLLPTTMALHAELERFGIPVPPRMYLVGSRHRDGSPQAFIVACAIDGVDLLDAVAVDGRRAGGVDRVCCALIRYYEVKYREGGCRLSDLKLEQFVFGPLDGDHRLWMVDLDPGYVEITPATGDAQALASLHWRVAEVARILTSVERVSGMALVETRRRFEDLLASDMFRHPSASGRAAAIAQAIGDGTEIDGARWVREQLRAGG
jgi:hypothetical protein